MGFDGSRAEFYRGRAAEVRATADVCHDAAVKSQLELVARDYEALAKSVEAGILNR